MQKGLKKCSQKPQTLSPKPPKSQQKSSQKVTSKKHQKKHQTSTQVIDLQQDFLGVENRRWILVNNDDIPIITSNQVSWGFTFKKNNRLVSMDNFYKKVDGITSRSQGFQNQLEFERISGKYTIIGSEILVQKQIQNCTGHKTKINEFF